MSVIVCEKVQDLLELSGRHGFVRGVYHQLDVRQRKRGTPVHVGHAALRMPDDTEVLLEPTWSPAAIRNSAELQRWDGREVVVGGVIHGQCPEPPEPAAAIIGPCISPVDSVTGYKTPPD